MKTIVMALVPALVLFMSSCNNPNAEEVSVKQTFVLSDTMLKTTTTSVVTTEPLRNELKFFGKITADNNKMIDVYPVVGGNVIKVYAELGDYVKKGQLLATIRSTEVAGFEKELQDAQNDVLIAKKNLKVAEELFEGKLNTERDILEAKGQLDKAQSQLSRVQQTYRIYNLKPGSLYEVRSPISGFIIDKNINADMQLRSDRSDNIFDIAQIDDVWAIANVNESEIEKVKLGMDASVFTISYPNQAYSGKVDKIFNIIDPETKAMKVRVRLNNHDYRLKPEMRASIVISYNEGRDMLSVPSSAVIFDKSKSFVMIFKDRYNIETRQVEVCRQVGETTFLFSGVKEGEKVITQNQLLIYDALND